MSLAVGFSAIAYARWQQSQKGSDMKAELQPIFETYRNEKTGREKQRVEKVLVRVDGYPHFMMPLSMVWDASKEERWPELLKKIERGERVIVDIAVRRM